MPSTLLTRLAVLGAVVAPLALVSPALAQYTGTGGGTSTPTTDEILSTRPQRAPEDAYTRAERHMENGYWENAAILLRFLAERGAGYEVAQYKLGVCLFEMAKGEGDAARADAMRREAAMWMTRAAESGQADAQLRLAEFYLVGYGLEKDSIEAAKWALLYTKNPSRIALTGQPPKLPPAMVAALEASVSAEQLTEARTRAAAWTPTVQGGVASN